MMLLLLLLLSASEARHERAQRDRQTRGARVTSGRDLNRASTDRPTMCEVDDSVSAVSCVYIIISASTDCSMFRNYTTNLLKYHTALAKG